MGAAEPRMDTGQSRPPHYPHHSPRGLGQRPWTAGPPRRGPRVGTRSSDNMPWTHSAGTKHGRAGPRAQTCTHDTREGHAHAAPVTEDEGAACDRVGGASGAPQEQAAASLGVSRLRGQFQSPGWGVGDVGLGGGTPPQLPGSLEAQRQGRTLLPGAPGAAADRDRQALLGRKPRGPGGSGLGALFPGSGGEAANPVPAGKGEPNGSRCPWPVHGATTVRGSTGPTKRPAPGQRPRSGVRTPDSRAHKLSVDKGPGGSRKTGGAGSTEREAQGHGQDGAACHDRGRWLGVPRAGLAEVPSPPALGVRGAHGQGGGAGEGPQPPTRQEAGQGTEDTGWTDVAQESSWGDSEEGNQGSGGSTWLQAGATGWAGAGEPGGRGLGGPRTDPDRTEPRHTFPTHAVLPGGPVGLSLRAFKSFRAHKGEGTEHLKRTG